MNPFDLPGPQFLVFYVVLASVVIVAALLVRRQRELGESGYHGTPLHDPYAIAFLRGGKPEMVRVAVVSLVDRGLLSAERDAVQTTTVGRGTSVRRRIEEELLEFCRTRREPKELFSGSAFEGAAAEVEHELSWMRLLPDHETNAMRRRVFFGAAAVLLFFSVVKIGVALARGRTNVLFLIILTVVALLLLRRLTLARRTARGDTFLGEVQNLFRSLRLRAPQLRPGGATSEVAMLAAVFGLAALPKETFAWSHALFPRAAKGDGSGCGSSCGSSCGSGCGGGCGGGGCGGCGG